MIEDLLPLLRGWAYKAYDIDVPKLVKAGTFKVMGEERKHKGWVSMFLVVLDNPRARFIIEGTDSTGAVQKTDLTPEELYNTGSTFWTPAAVFLQRYDTSNNVYVVVYTPRPWLSFYTAKLTVQAPADSDVTVLGAHALLIIIVDEDEFKKSLHEVLFGIRSLPR